MSNASPTMEGFRAAFRQPLFTVAEITWRWVVGATATVLLLFGLIEFLDTLPVTNGPSPATKPLPMPAAATESSRCCGLAF